VTIETPDFLDISDVLELHALQIARYGGADGLRDRGLLESALAQPKATFAGELLHEDLFSMAAAYLFHIVQNHPFVDGNKRTGLIAALVFLDLNGISIAQGSPDLHDLTMGVARGELTKDAAAEVLRQIARIH
jgi:death on curing protein